MSYRISIAALLFAVAANAGQGFQDLEKQTTSFTLSNGMRMVVSERHGNPKIAVWLQVGAGSMHDPAGASGLARLFERLFPEGPESFGTRDSAGERKALEAVEEAMDRLDAERDKGSAANDVRVAMLDFEARKTIDTAHGFQTDATFLKALEESGFDNFGLSVGMEASALHAEFPSNRAEQWFLLGSQWLARPSFRNFYAHCDAAANEQMRNETGIEYRVMQTLSGAALPARPYGNPVGGRQREVRRLRATAARQFFTQYYVPGNITIAIVGDITAAEARRLADRYLAPIPARPMPPALPAAPGPQTGPRRMTVENVAEPMVALGFPRPARSDGDDAALGAIQALLAHGRGGWLWRELVEKQRLATSVEARRAFPGGLYPNLFTIAARPAAGHTTDELEAAIIGVLGRLQGGPVDAATLQTAHAQAHAAFLSNTGGNAALARLLAEKAAESGDWKQLMESYDRSAAVTAEQIRAAAVKYFSPSQRTSVHATPPPPHPAETTKQGAK